MKLSIVTAVCGKNEITEEWLNTTVARCNGYHELIIVSNGSSSEEVGELANMLDHQHDCGWVTRLIVSDDPLGTTAAFQRGAKESTGDIIAMLHNDLEIKESGWDSYLIDFMKRSFIGVVGFVGALRLGDYSIYKVPYFMAQLARFDVFSSQDDAEKHGRRLLAPTRVAVLDGMAMIVNRTVFKKVGGLDIKYVHHMYDNDFCLSVIEAGYDNWVIPLEVHHRGGMTSCGTEYDSWVRNELQLDGDGEVHRNSHEYFYEKWRDRLPVSV